MSDIPYNYRKYIDDVTKMTQRGAISSGEQMQSPSSAGSRGLAKTMQFTNNKTQMQLGQEAIAESMVEIRNIMNRIDGLNVTEAESDYLYLNGKEIDQGSIMYKMEDYSDGIFELQSAKYADGTELDEKELEELESTQELIDWVMIDFVSESAVQEDIGDKGRIALEKAGFDPMKVKEYMAAFNDHGDTSDIDQMNMDKVGLADAMAMVLASHDVENESYQPMPEGDEFNIEEDEDFEEVLGALGFPEDETELFDAEYQGRKVPLNKPMRGDVKKFKVYVKDPSSGNVKKVNFGHGGTSAKRPTMRIRKSNPKARKSFRARHNCANPGPKTKARYWSCRKW
jgi:hypothetical protein